ncbi:23S rRNA m(5)U-747 methyltransferase [Nicoletella semolina]|uniref:23S rRNA (uracil(747)-C(5))-methyltransferase RlmC n=1 Tax=Nicoletella semolina TaxID=271160 RepID=A0A4R2N9Y1_9PAST|nr:23S rRNA (uracil(747)-C(5))-methyltransferase RlmC [Nicoletella semolina]MDH2925321.1 23S rRNA (uracil(747)-C(5))-methyltransferase [Nicoletella semolina]TCP17798.1 23S rRNA m(5)U-747 methyltransferase [Nicoletella semolina]
MKTENQLQCIHFAEKRCSSCQWIERDYCQQIADKSEELKRLISPYLLQSTQILAPIYSPIHSLRNKAKMVVSGSVERPILGILSDNNGMSGVDLTDCPLYPSSFYRLFPILKDFIARAGLVPYNVAKKRGELKYILLTESQYNQAIMLRFVLKSEQKRPLVERELTGLLAKLPKNSVVSLNIQPQHAALLEGEQEIFLTERRALEEHFNGIPLFIRPQGFFQTNPQVASQLYATAQSWVSDLPIRHLWDLFCGVGGFGLHCAKKLQECNKNVSLTGIEISPAAIESAIQSAKQIGLTDVSFASLDSAKFALEEKSIPDLVIVNPPRRGIGKVLANFLNTLGPSYLIYSSCNAKTMAQDLAVLSDYILEKVQLFDMFPHTAHYESMVLLRKIRQ